MSDKGYSSVWVQDKTVDKQLLNTSCILDPGSNAVTWLCQEWLLASRNHLGWWEMLGMQGSWPRPSFSTPVWNCLPSVSWGLEFCCCISIAGEGHSLNMFWNFLIRLSAGIYLGLKKCFPDEWGSSWLDGLLTSTGLLGALSLLRNQKHVGETKGTVL